MFSNTYFSSLKVQVTIDADHPIIRDWERIDFTNSKATAFEFYGVTIYTKFIRTSIKAKIQDFGAHGATTTNYFYKIIDGSGT